MKINNRPLVPPLFKASPHSVYHLMGGVENKPITEKQLFQLKELEKREKLTPKMQETLAVLKAKRDAPRFNNKAPLSDGAKTLAIKFLKEFLYGRKAPKVKAIQMDKGIVCEDESIDFAGKYYNWVNPKKNEKVFENNFFIGTPDLLIRGKVIDVKNAFDFMSFPLYETKTRAVNECQVLAYMSLTKKKKGGVVYILMNIPNHLLERLYWQLEGINPKCGLIKEGSPTFAYTPEFLDFSKTYKYDNVANKLRIKRFNIDYDEEKIKAMEQRVLLVRDFINGLIIKQYG